MNVEHIFNAIEHRLHLYECNIRHWECIVCKQYAIKSIRYTIEWVQITDVSSNSMRFSFSWFICEIYLWTIGAHFIVNRMKWALIVTFSFQVNNHCHKIYSITSEQWTYIIFIFLHFHFIFSLFSDPHSLCRVFAIFFSDSIIFVFVFDFPSLKIETLVDILFSRFVVSSSYWHYYLSFFTRMNM